MLKHLDAAVAGINPAGINFAFSRLDNVAGTP